MYERDYIMRMVKQFAQALARVGFDKQSQPLERTFEQLNQLSSQFTGLDLPTLRGLPITQLRELLSIQGRLDINHAYMVGCLLQEDAELTAQQEARHFASATKALSLLADVALEFGEFLDEEHRSRLLMLYDSLKDEPLAIDLYRLVFEVFYLSGYLDKAEDVLFRMLVLDEHAQEMAKAYYLDLLARSDDELVQGKLPRQEVLEGLCELGIDIKDSTAK